MPASTEIPARDTYNFVLRRCTPLEPSVKETVSIRGENAKDSHNIVHPDGHRRRTIFVVQQNARDRLIKLGWEDVTEMFHDPSVLEARREAERLHNEEVERRQREAQGASPQSLQEASEQLSRPRRRKAPAKTLRAGKKAATRRVRKTAKVEG